MDSASGGAGSRRTVSFSPLVNEASVPGSPEPQPMLIEAETRNPRLGLPAFFTVQPRTLKVFGV